MIDNREQRHILDRATVPEHALTLMESVSGGEPFWIEGLLCFSRGDWLVVVGYPLEGGEPPEPGGIEASVRGVLERFQPRFASVVAPRVPESLAASSRERDRDVYYTVPLEGFRPGEKARRAARRAAREVRVERARTMGEAHRELSREFLARVRPPHRVQDLIWKMPRFTAGAEDALVLNARDEQGKLSAFWVADLEPGPFSTYVIGCHSRKRYVPGASDLLCSELLRLSREQGKRFVHLGLGLTPGIRRFKEKWGGVPGPDYEAVELVLRRPSLLDVLRGLR